MEGVDGGEKKKESMVERKRQEGFSAVCDAIDARLPKSIGDTFEVGGREYELTSADDCMVAYAQALRAEMATLHDEVVRKDEYYEERATAKLLELFKVYERLVTLYAELRSYYPEAAGRVVPHIPSLTECTEHAESLWKDVQKQK